MGKSSIIVSENTPDNDIVHLDSIGVTALYIQADFFKARPGFYTLFCCWDRMGKARQGWSRDRRALREWIAMPGEELEDEAYKLLRVHGESNPISPEESVTTGPSLNT